MTRTIALAAAASAAGLSAPAAWDLAESIDPTLDDRDAFITVIQAAHASAWGRVTASAR